MIATKFNSLFKKPVLVEDLGTQFETEKSKNKFRQGLFRCDCGNIFKARVSCVKYGTVKSCGCLVSKTNRILMSKTFKTHGLSKHPIYNIWRGMLYRCNNKKSANFKYYGGRGIKVCKRWLKIENFIEDMYPSFKEGLSLDRIDNDKGYSPDNCRWANQSTQINNTRTLISTNTSGYVGIWYRKDRNKYAAELKINNKKVSIGCYKNKEVAMLMREIYIIENNLKNKRNLKNETKSEIKKLLENQISN